MKTVFFDLGNVLIFFSHQKMCEQIAAVYETSFASIYEILFKKGLAKEYESGFISSEELHMGLSKSLGKQGDFFALMQAASAIFTPNPAIYPLVHRLKKEAVQLILLSNTCEAHFNYAYSHFPILQLFDRYLLSYEVKLRKPAPLIFRKALSLSGSPPADCFYTDDLQENIRAARKEGIDAEIFTDADSLEKHLTVRNIL